MRLRISTLLFFGLMALGLAPAANAAFLIQIQDVAAGTTIDIFDGGPLDVNPDPSIITVNTDLLNADPALANFRFGSLGATSNATIASGNQMASLTQGGEVFRLAGTTGTASIRIQVTDTNYFAPELNPKLLDSTASDSWQFTKSTDSRTFQSFFGPNNGELELGIPSDPLAFTAPNKPGSTSGTAATTALGDQATPFSLTNETFITLGPGGVAGQEPKDQFQGNTTVVAIPEPSALALSVLGLPVLVLRRLRRKTA